MCFAHAFSGNCRRPGNCQWQHEPFPAAFYKDVASSRRPGNSNACRRLAAMTETQYNTAAEPILILEEAPDETESAGADDDGQAGASIDQHEQIEGTSRRCAPGKEDLGNGHDFAAPAPWAARQERVRDQLWVRGQIWHRHR